MEGGADEDEHRREVLEFQPDTALRGGLGRRSRAELRPDVARSGVRLNISTVRAGSRWRLAQTFASVRLGSGMAGGERSGGGVDRMHR